MGTLFSSLFLLKLQHKGLTVLHSLGRVLSPIVFNAKSASSKYPALPKYRQVTAQVVTCLGMNPGPFTLQGTNTYIVGTGQRRILVDSGDGRAEYVSVLEECMEAFRFTGIQEVLITHRHYDHVGGLPLLIKRFGPLKVSKFMTREDFENSDKGNNYQPIRDGQLFETEGATLRAVHTPGHTDDHVAFVLEEDGTLFTGDCVLGHGTPVFEELSQYMQSLHRLESLTPPPARLCPGHGAVLDSTATAMKHLSVYIAHRRDREHQIIEVLKGTTSAAAASTPIPNADAASPTTPLSDSDPLLTTQSPAAGPGGVENGAWSVEEIVAVLYRGVPVWVLHAASRVVRQHLLKLESDGLVVRKRMDGILWGLLGEDETWSWKEGMSEEDKCSDL